jgi:hypothetical protein
MERENGVQMNSCASSPGPPGLKKTTSPLCLSESATFIYPPKVSPRPPNSCLETTTRDHN